MILQKALARGSSGKASVATVNGRRVSSRKLKRQAKLGQRQDLNTFLDLGQPGTQRQEVWRIFSASGNRLYVLPEAMT
jgi:hypothetical protein